MMNVTGRRPFSELGDQQLLDQTRRLAANQRSLELHILDHLDEIDRRGLVLRRGFSSLFDYAVRELRFSDAAAQRRIQAMRLCRRHGWVRASLQSGELNMTSAAQLETTFAGAERAERAERQCGTGRRNVGQGRCHDQDHDSGGRTRQLGLPAAPGEADEHGERGPQSAPGRAPRAEQCSSDAAAAHAPAVAPAGAQDRGSRHGLSAGGGGTTVVPAAVQERGAGHAGVLRPPERSGAGDDGGRDASHRATELNGNALSSLAALRVPVSAAPSSDDGAAPHVSPTIRSTRAPEPVAAPSQALRVASRVPDSPAAPLLHPQRQRELIEQAAGMSTRQVTGLLAAAGPEVVPPRDTLRAVAPDRFTLKVSIDQECEQGLRLLKGLLSHRDPRMSWGDLVARVVREAVARHDPRGGGSGQMGRHNAGSAGASPRRTPNKTRAAGAAAGPAQRANESSRRAPNRTRAAGAPAQRGSDTPAPEEKRTRRVAAPALPAQCACGATGAPHADAAGAGRRNPIAIVANAAAPRQSAPAAPADDARAGGVPAGAPAAAAALQFAAGASANGSDAGAAMPVAPVATPAPEPAPGVSPDGGPRGASAVAAPGASAEGFHAGAAVPVSQVATPALEPALSVPSDGGLNDASSAVAAAHTNRDSVHNSHQSPPRRHIPAAVRRHVWQRDGGRCCYRDPLSGRRCTSSHLLQIDHLLPVAEGGGPDPANLALACFAHHRMRHGYGPAPPPERPM